MRHLNEQERIAHRRLAKRILSDLKSELGEGIKKAEEVAATTSRAISEAVKAYGADALWLKSYMIRIRKGVE